MDVAGWMSTVCGAGLVLLVLRDVFDRLWHPSARGGLSQWLLSGVWRLTARVRRRAGRRPRAIELTGSAAMGTVVGSWVLLLVTGWTLIYLPAMPEGFTFAGGDDPRSAGAADALYLSLVTLSTLGFGDVVPDTDWLRLLVPLEALMGFVLLTAAVAWLLQVFPVLSRRRGLAARLSLVRRTGGAAEWLGPHPTSGLPLLDEVTTELVRARVDLVQHAETYYVADGARDVALSAVLDVALDLAAAAQARPDPAVRRAGQALAAALDDLIRLIDRDYLHVGGSPVEVLDAYAADQGHRCEPPVR